MNIVYGWIHSFKHPIAYRSSLARALPGGRFAPVAFGTAL